MSYAIIREILRRFKRCRYFSYAILSENRYFYAMLLAICQWNIELRFVSRDDSVSGNILYRILVKLRKQGSSKCQWYESISPYLHLLLLFTLHVILHAHLSRYIHTHTHTHRLHQGESKKKKVPRRQCTLFGVCLCWWMSKCKTHETKKNDWKQ